MKIKYTFANEIIEIDVDENYGNLLLDFDRRERNNQQTETRRHCSLEAYNLDDNFIPSAVNVENEVIRNDEYKKLYRAIGQLLPQQQELVKKVFFEKRTVAEIAREEGVDYTAIRDRLNRIYKKLKKYLK